MAPQRGLGRRQIEPHRVPAAVEPFDPARAGAGLDDAGIRVPPGEIFYSTQITRLFRRGTNWDRSPSFGRDDLLTVAKVADIANTRIHELQAEARSAGREAEPEADAAAGGDD